MAKQFVVIRGQIEKGKEVLAKRGQPYKPKNKAEEDRLVKAGVIGEAPGSQKASEPEGNQEPTQGAGGE
jgi:cytochrome c-type biogenesis protein CcmE